jgi:hypothetical protein
MINQFLHDRIVAMAEASNTDTGESRLICDEIINLALKALPQLPQDVMVFPTFRNSIQYEIDIGNTYVEIEIHIDKAAVLVMTNGFVVIEEEMALDKAVKLFNRYYKKAR